jgi:AcrR family transcriptional regulator
MKHDRRQDILTAAMQLFAEKGFRGTTTRDLAARAGVNEAIIFRHFKTKDELYSAIIQHKASEWDARYAQFEKLAAGADDQKFFETLGRNFLEKHEHDTTFPRLLLFSALEGHQLSEMFVASMASRNPFRAYIQRRIDEGSFRSLDPELVARAFFGLFFNFVLWQEVFGFKQVKPFDRDEVVRTYVSIFLSGISKE